MKDIRIIVKTNKGPIESTLFASKVPATTASFLNLASRGYYNGLKFHRVIPSFMIHDMHAAKANALRAERSR